jgi:hypothetical protein
MNHTGAIALVFAVVTLLVATMLGPWLERH